MMMLSSIDLGLLFEIFSDCAADIVIQRMPRWLILKIKYQDMRKAEKII